jgi:hypothetical protein
MALFYLRDRVKRQTNRRLQTVHGRLELKSMAKVPTFSYIHAPQARILSI